MDLSNALAISFTKSPNGDNTGPYHYIKNDTDLFSITRTGTSNASARFIARIYDYNMTAETGQFSTTNGLIYDVLARRVEGSNSNQSLTLELTYV